jgi:GNAT superfamily N-acetyltransferase
MLIRIRDMRPEDEYFVSTCSHVNENEEHDEIGRRRQPYLRTLIELGMRVKVAELDGERVGFVYAVPIEHSPWGPAGRDLLAIPCIWILKQMWRKGAGRLLLIAVEEEARKQGRKGVTTYGYTHDFWFMQASFFEKHGYLVAGRKGDTVLLWKALDPTAEPPRFLERKYRFEPVEGKIVIDLFHHTFCATLEADNVREVAAEFGDRVLLNEYDADDREVFDRFGIFRAIFVQGEEIGWGYTAPKEGIREAITKKIENET